MWATTAINQSGVQAETPVGDATTIRESIFIMTGEAEAAVLRPVDSGAWPHGLRAALASRVARINGLMALADNYLEMIIDPEYQSLAQLENNGASQELQAVVEFMDKVAANPRDVVNTDIKGLQSAGIADADIVRLTQLNAFMAYQVRLVAGLTMLSGSKA